MNKYKLFAFLLCSFLQFIGAQEPCVKPLEKAEQLLKNASPFTNDQTLFKLVEPCAQTGNAKAENYLGMFYLKGIGVKKNEDRAFAHISKSAHKGYASAQYNIGRLYKYGIGCDIDFETAVSWFEKGSANGSQKAAYSLGYMYYKGFGVTQDYTKAVYWFKRSTDPMARHFLGLCYYLGYGVAPNETKALEILLDNPITNSKTLIASIRAEQKKRVAHKTKVDLAATNKATNPIAPEVVIETQHELEYYPEDNLELEDIKGKWSGKLVQYDWSGKHIRRIIPVDIAIKVNDQTGVVQVKSTLENQELTSTAIWQDETLYLEDVTQTLTLNRLYPEQPKRLTIAYNLFAASLQKYTHNSTNYLIGYVDTYIPEWKEYGKPMSLVLKPEGAESTLSEDALLALAAQEDQFIKLYPVPFYDKLTVQYQLETASNVFVELYSLHGSNRITILPTTEQQAGDYTYTIPVNPSLPEGLYVVRIMAGDQVYTRMIVKDF